MSPKEWLAANCPLKSDKDHKCVKPNQRGRMSLEHHEILKEHEKEISGYESGTRVTKSGHTSPVNKSSNVPAQKVVYELAYRYNESQFRAVEIESGRARGMREACHKCGLSLLGCFCDTPRIVATGHGPETSVLVKVVAK